MTIRFAAFYIITMGNLIMLYNLKLKLVAWLIDIFKIELLDILIELNGGSIDIWNTTISKK